MTLQRLILRQGDRLPGFVGLIIDEDARDEDDNEQPFDLTGLTAKIWMQRIGGRATTAAGFDAWTVPKDASIVGAATNGTIRYDWQASDTAGDPGTFALTAFAVGASTVRTAPTRRLAIVELRSALIPS